MHHRIDDLLLDCAVVGNKRVLIVMMTAAPHLRYDQCQLEQHWMNSHLSTNCHLLLWPFLIVLTSSDDHNPDESQKKDCLLGGYHPLDSASILSVDCDCGWALTIPSLALFTYPHFCSHVDLLQSLHLICSGLKCVARIFIHALPPFLEFELTLESYRTCATDNGLGSQVCTVPHAARATLMLELRATAMQDAHWPGTCFRAHYLSHLLRQHLHRSSGSLQELLAASSNRILGKCALSVR